MATAQLIEKQISDVLNQLDNLPAPVKKWEIDTGTDSTGENAVWIWAIIEDASLAQLSQNARARLRDRIRDAVRQVSPMLRAYIRFRAASEV